MIRHPWGGSTPTRLAQLGPGCTVVVQRLSDSVTARRAVANARTLAAARLPSPVPIVDARGRFVAWQRATGTPGPALLATAQGDRLAFEMGRVARRIGELPARSFPLDPSWATPDDLRVAVGRWLEQLQDDRGLLGDRSEAIRRAVTNVANGKWSSPCPTHGDFVPANVIASASGRIEVLLDVADMACRDPDVDIAWWELVVGFHHAAEAERLCSSLRSGYGPHEQGVVKRRRAVAIVRALQLAASAEPASRDHAIALLVAAVDARAV